MAGRKTPSPRTRIIGTSRFNTRLYVKVPHELSGGQQQRIGVLRALAADQSLILMDEPFGALDPITRDSLQEEFKKLQKKLDKTIVFVTHDMDEALKTCRSHCHYARWSIGSM